MEKVAPMEKIREEVEEWVMEPDTMTGRALDYECLMILYWVMNNLMSHVLMEGGNKKQGDVELVQAWKGNP